MIQTPEDYKETFAKVPLRPEDYPSWLIKKMSEEMAKEIDRQILEELIKTASSSST